MDVCCFEEESSDTIIYCFCADLETVKGAVVNPEVRGWSALVSARNKEAIAIVESRMRLGLDH